MQNGTYGGVRSRKTKVGRKLLRFPLTRLCLYFNEFKEVRENKEFREVREKKEFKKVLNDHQNYHSV